MRKSLDKKALWKEIHREDKKKARQKLAGLRVQIRDARTARRLAMSEAKAACRTGRLQVREEIQERRAAVLAELRELDRRERLEAREACRAAKTAAKSLEYVERGRAELEAERSYRRELRRLEQANKHRHKERVTAAERRSESDDEVRGNIPPELVGLFERVKRQIKGSPRMSRTEAFLHYAEEHPGEVLVAIEDRTEQVIRELEAEERRARKELRRPTSRRRRFTREELAETPF